jgi:hypothetical protein
VAASIKGGPKKAKNNRLGFLVLSFLFFHGYEDKSERYDSTRGLGVFVLLWIMYKKYALLKK